MNKTGSDAVVACAEWGISPITSEALPSIHRQAKAVKEDRPPLLCKKVNNTFAIPYGQINFSHKIYFGNSALPFGLICSAA